MPQHPYPVSTVLFILIDAHPHFSLQNSKDNMSAVLVTFPNAPKVSQDAIAKVGSRLGEEKSRGPMNVCICIPPKVHLRSVDPQKNRRNYLITSSILIFSAPYRSSLQRSSFDIIYIYI